jgi:hypothetical protein
MSRAKFKIGDIVVITSDNFFMRTSLGILSAKSGTPNWWVVSFDDGKIHTGFDQREFRKIGELTIEEFLTNSDEDIRKEGLRRIRLEK